MKAEKFRQRLAYLHAYAGLYWGLDPGPHGSRNQKTSEMLNGVGEFLKGAAPADVLARGPALCSLLERGTPRRKGMTARQAREAIGRDFISLGKDYDVWRYGITYGWVLERFETPLLGLPRDLPAHARIGIGHHAGSVSTEEVALLDDAFFLHAMTRAASDRMMAESERHKLVEQSTVARLFPVHAFLTGLNMNVATYARSTVLTSVAFVESVVNSVGSNAATTKHGLDLAAEEQLRGMRKGRYLSLEYKLEKYPSLIRTDGQSPLRVIDEAQRKEPFRRFLAGAKDVRDASMHFGPSKTPIICTPQEWSKRAEEAIDDAVGVAQAFWAACYPTAGPPEYLNKLDVSTFKERASLRS